MILSARSMTDIVANGKILPCTITLFEKSSKKYSEEYCRDNLAEVTLKDSVVLVYFHDEVDFNKELDSEIFIKDEAKLMYKAEIGTVFNSRSVAFIIRNSIKSNTKLEILDEVFDVEIKQTIKYKDFNYLIINSNEKIVEIIKKYNPQNPQIKIIEDNIVKNVEVVEFNNEFVKLQEVNKKETKYFKSSVILQNHFLEKKKVTITYQEKTKDGNILLYIKGRDFSYFTTFSELFIIQEVNNLCVSYQTKLEKLISDRACILIVEKEHYEQVIKNFENKLPKFSLIVAVKGQPKASIPINNELEIGAKMQEYSRIHQVSLDDITSFYMESDIISQSKPIDY